MILIDTPGIGAGDSEVGEDLAQVFSSHPEIDVHLVLPATMKSEDLHSAARRFAPLGATKLIFTRIDEAASLGSVAGESDSRGVARLVSLRRAADPGRSARS